jgi:hypothetical protein
MIVEIPNVVSDIVEDFYPLCLDINRQKKHISLVLHKKKIVAMGCNHFKTHPKTVEYGYMFEEMHSELDAYRKIPKNLLKKKLILVNLRYNRFGEMRMSKPCHICESWCRQIFSKIYYTTDSGIVNLEF